VNIEPLKRIMVPLDFSPVTDPIIEFAGMLALKHNAELLLLHVIEESIVEHVASGYNAEALVSELEDKAKEKMTIYREKLSSMNVKATIYSDYIIGDPASVIAHIAGEENVSEVLITSKGWGLKRLIPLGSTARLVINMSPVPVIRVKAVKDDGIVKVIGDPERLFDNILVSIIPGFSETAINYILNLAIKNRSKITLVYVDEGNGNLEFINDLASLFRDNNIDVDRIILKGIPYKRIINVAEQLDVTSVIIERRIKHGLREILMGSTFSNLANKLNKPLVIVPESMH